MVWVGRRVVWCDANGELRLRPPTGYRRFSVARSAEPVHGACHADGTWGARSLLVVLANLRALAPVDLAQ